MAVTPSELADTLRRRYRRRRQTAIQRRDVLRAQLDDVVQQTALGKPHRVWLIGSLAQEHWGPRSDVDVVVEGLSEKEATALWGRLESRLDAPVEVLRLEELDEEFRQRVLEEGTLLRETPT